MVVRCLQFLNISYIFATCLPYQTYSEEKLPVLRHTITGGLRISSFILSPAADPLITTYYSPNVSRYDPISLNEAR